MNPEIEVLTKSIAELKTIIIQNRQSENMNINPALYGVIGAIIGGIVTVLMNLFKDKIMFERNRKKEEQTRKQEILKREDDIIRKLFSRLFGLGYSLMHNAKAHNFCAVGGGYYCRMIDFESDKDARFVLIELMREQNNHAQSALANFVANLQELSEIVGEFSYLMPDSKVGELYLKFLNSGFHINFSFENKMTQIEIAKYRAEILSEYSNRIGKIATNAMEIAELMEKESGIKFNAKFM